MLQFATNYTMVRGVDKPGTWERVEQEDLTEGTFPAGSAWRHVVKIVLSSSDAPQLLRRDLVVVPQVKMIVGKQIRVNEWKQEYFVVNILYL